tara:strand:- start:1571 stop:3352 length:1782 start_codon:yes stop_codon:yes gene_type:complete
MFVMAVVATLVIVAGETMSRKSFICFLLFLIGCTFQSKETDSDLAPAYDFVAYPPASGLGTMVEVGVDANWSVFSFGGTSFDFGEGISVLHTNVDDGWSARARIQIDSDAELGSRDIIVYSDSREYTIEDAFEVVSQSFILNPTSGKIGECVEVGILGKNTAWIGGLTWPHFGDGVEVLDFEVITSTLAEASISINEATIPGWRSVVVDSGNGDYTVVYDAFKVDRVGLGAYWDPPLAEQGETVEFSIEAKNTNFLSSTLEIKFIDRFGENPDIVIQDVYVLDAENLYGRMRLSNAAALGGRDVIIDTSDDSVRINDAFEVTGLDWSLTNVVIDLEFHVVRWTDETTCELKEKVTATAVFFIPLDPPCGGGSGQPQDGPSPYDNNGLYEIAEGSVSVEDCPFPTTLSAGDYVWYESPYNIVTLEKTYDSATGAIIYRGHDLTFADYVPNQFYDLHTQGDPDGIGEYILEGVQPTVPADWFWISPDMCDLVQSQADGFPFEWTPAQTYPSAIFGTFVYGTLIENNKSGFAGVLPWDDGIHAFTPLEMSYLKPEQVRQESLSYIKGPYFGLPESIYQNCRSDSYIAYVSDFYLEE